MQLSETVELMNSDSYRERFRAEYYQLKIRTDSLRDMLHAWDSGELEFEPTCPRSAYDLQLKAMMEYKALLVMRAAIEHVNLLVTPKTSS